MKENILEKYYVFEDKYFLTDESLIEEYFKENGFDFFDCEDEPVENPESFICKIKSQLYLVEIHASFKKEYIGRENLLETFVEKITKVNYEKIELK